MCRTCYPGCRRTSNHHSRKGCAVTATANGASAKRGESFRRESEASGPPGGRAEVGHDHSLLVPFDRDAPRGAVPIERVLVGVPAEQIARAEEKIAGVHCFGTDAHVEREWVELAAPTHLFEASGK